VPRDLKSQICGRAENQGNWQLTLLGIAACGFEIRTVKGADAMAEVAPE
jgi:hypothetical protein